MASQRSSTRCLRSTGAWSSESRPAGVGGCCARRVAYALGAPVAIIGAGRGGVAPLAQIPVAIETTRGLLVNCLRATGRLVYAINPLAVAHYRQRHTVSRAKSDHADAMTLANILRTDAAAHRPMPADTPLVQAIAVLARAQQDAVWNRTQLCNQLRSVLREYFPAGIEAFNLKNVGLTSA